VPRDPNARRIDGDRLVIPHGARGISVYDISDPHNPVEAATVSAETLRDQAGHPSS